MVTVVVRLGHAVATEAVDHRAAGGAPSGSRAAVAWGWTLPSGDRTAGGRQPAIGDAVEAALGARRVAWPAPTRAARTGVPPDRGAVVPAAPRPSPSRHD